ncbi:MAG TPA: site-2 protease family protein [Anaeromyxobacteraceae bacterium]|nr:site-2 protease family protein [Anaeromyxobacteraceae bacterium]
MGAVETATFRPPIERLGPLVAAGAAGGALVGGALGVPLLLSAMFGAAAAGIALSARQASGLRLQADERGLRLLGAAPGLEAPWPEVRLGFGTTARDDGRVQRYAILADARGRSFAFAEVEGRARCQPVRGADGRLVPLFGLREAALLLALVVQRTGNWEVLPEPLRAAPASPAPAPDSPAPAPAAGTGQRARPGVGLMGVVAKLGTKLLGGLGKAGSGALKAAKTANLGWAAASAATWSILFSWKFALAIMVQLFVHEYGHVHAMRRSGMKVRGLYFVPFLGALAVAEDSFTSRRQQAYVALSGPIWGSVLALLPAGLWLWTGAADWAAVAAWWALLNLFNLLPIAPLDGGRVMHAFAWSFSSSLGLAASVAGLLGAVALGASLGLSLVWLVAGLGAMELAGEAQARAGVRALRLLPEPARLGAAQAVYLRGVLGPPPGSPSQPLFLRALERQRQVAGATPMRPAEIAAWGLGYAALAAGLVVLVWLLGHVPGADLAAGILS